MTFDTSGPNIPMRLTALGDRAITITVGSSIDEPTRQRVHAVATAIDDAQIAGVVETVPAFASVTVHYDPTRVPAGAGSPHATLAASLEAVLRDLRSNDGAPARIVDIPVCYGGDFGPDLDDVARQHAMSPDDVVRLHTAGEYRVFMVGFMPGFAYLGGLAEAIATPRRSSPRTAVPAGAVGIGGSQTGVYPMESPGGWNLIGRTPVKIFDLRRERQTLLSTGDVVRFHAISLAEYRARLAPA